MLLAARFVTGVAAAFMAPAGLALVTSTFPEGPARTRALGVYAGTAAGGFSLGLVAGGVLAVVAVERRSRSPLVRLGILRTVPLVRVNVAALLFLGAFAGFQFLATVSRRASTAWRAACSTRPSSSGRRSGCRPSPPSASPPARAWTRCGPPWPSRPRRRHSARS
ncbi:MULTISPECIES: hypothetical protein [Actinomadura]|uniref:hypothetical protein n=1 Tax=Actinomadura TaxID=1988 RepID=UPI00197ACE52|nr:hypothetical protein [Actinomadura geliboluensis]